MSDGAKIGLIFGGVAVVGFVLWKKSQATVPATTVTPGTTPTGTQQLTAHSPGSGAAPTLIGALTVGPKAIGAVATGAISTVTKIGSTFYQADKAVLGGAYSATKSIVGGATSVASSAVHSILSIF